MTTGMQLARSAMELDERNKAKTYTYNSGKKVKIPANLQPFVEAGFFTEDLTLTDKGVEFIRAGVLSLTLSTK